MEILQLKALPFIIPSLLICFISLMIKKNMFNEPVIIRGYVILGAFIGALLIIVHELLHAIAYPKDATVYIGIMPKSLSAVALSSSPVTVSRFIFISILPIILGLIPLSIFLLNPNLKILNSILFGSGIVGMTSIYPDLYNIYNVLKYVPSNKTIQNHKNATYYY